MEKSLPNNSVRKRASKRRESVSQLFISEKASETKKASFENLIFTDSVELSGTIGVEELSFYNCLFKKGFSFNNGCLLGGIKFTSCEFRGDVELIDMILKEKEDSASNYFFKCNFNFWRLSLFRVSCDPAYAVHWCDGIFINVHDSVFSESFICDGGTFSTIAMNGVRSSNVHLSSVDLSRDIAIDQSDFSWLNISKVTGNGFINIHNLKAKNFILSDSKFEKLNFSNVFGELDISRNVFSGNCMLDGIQPYENKINSYLGSITFTGNSFARVFQVSGKVRFDRIIINCNEGFSGSLNFDKCFTQYLGIRGINSGGDILFINSEIGELDISHFTNLGSLSFLQCTTSKTKAEISISNSDLGRARFVNHPFGMYSQVRIIHSFLSDILFVHCNWFSDEKLNSGGNYKARREVYRQLKQAADKQGDRIQALVFQAEELRAFEHEITNVTHWWSADRWILRLSKTNRFGLDWTVGLAWLLGWTLFLFVPMAILASSELSWKRADTYAECIKSLEVIFWCRLPIFVQLFNPAHNPLAYVNTSVSPLYFFLDGIHRIGAAFLIVQIISAFRKYTKS